MRWYDTAPQGTLHMIYRFSKVKKLPTASSQPRKITSFSQNIEIVDLSLAISLQSVNSLLATFAASVITESLVLTLSSSFHPFLVILMTHLYFSVIFPLFFLPVSIIGIVYRTLAIGYLNTGRDLRLMELNSRSPIFSGLSELLEGIVTVRALSAEKRFRWTSLESRLDNSGKRSMEF